MSRTDGHEPQWVKDTRYGKIHHDHRNGECEPRTYHSPADRNQPRWTRYRLGDWPCWVERPHWDYCPYGRDRLHKDGKRQFHGAERARVRNALQREQWEDVPSYGHGGPNGGNWWY